MQSEIENEGYDRFFDAMVEGRLQFGQTLKQEEMAEILGISLSPMRETTTLLEAEGLITVRRRIGITVFTPDFKFLGNCYQLRGLLEKEGLRKFCRLVSDDWLERMRQSHEDIIAFVREVDDMPTYRLPIRKLERDFHDAFIAAFENDQINRIYARLSQKMYLFRLHNIDAVNTANTVQAMTEHLSVLDALAQRDADAAIEALDRHLKGVLHRVLTT